ncbi:MAG: heparinase II/III family protein, partial [Rikenellaceae bacterium]
GQSAKLLDYLMVLNYATGGKVAIFDDPILKNFAEFISRAYVGNGWGINFADAGARVAPPISTVYNFGKMVKSDELMQFASLLYKENPSTITADRYLIRTLIDLLPIEEIKQSPAAHNLPLFTWYDQTEFCFMGGSEGFFVGAKGGFNAESHNHNDAGSFNLHLNTIPMFIDAGVDTYTKKTFSSQRYTIWSMQSNYHNVPIINGVAQKYGKMFKTSGTNFNAAKMRFETDIAGTYPSSAEVKSWKRAYTLNHNELTITDDFILNKTITPNQINFMTWGNVDISKMGVIVIDVKGQKVSLSYNKSEFTPVVETIDLKGTNLSRTWGGEIYRISLKARTMKSKGK